MMKRTLIDSYEVEVFISEKFLHIIIGAKSAPNNLKIEVI